MRITFLLVKYIFKNISNHFTYAFKTCISSLCVSFLIAEEIKLFVNVYEFCIIKKKKEILSLQWVYMIVMILKINKKKDFIGS